MIRYFTTAFLVSLASGALAQDCTPVRFNPGESGAFIDGVLPPKVGASENELLCFSLDVRKGQQIVVEVVGGDENVALTVLDVGDARRSFNFKAPSNRVEFLVFQLMRSPSAADFSLLVQAN